MTGVSAAARDDPEATPRGSPAGVPRRGPASRGRPQSRGGSYWQLCTLTPVAVRLQPDDPVKGFIRADEVTRTYVPWLIGPVGMIAAATLGALAAALRTEMDL